MDLENASKAHAEWKTKFRVAINNKEKMDAMSIAKDNLCVLGGWLYGEGKSKYGSLDAFRKCVELHAAFHKEASLVAQKINAEKFGEAETMIGSGTTYTDASQAIGIAIIQLQREISKAA